MVLRNLSTFVPEIFHSIHFIRKILIFPVQPVLVGLYELTSFSPRSWNISIKIHISSSSPFGEELALISRHPAFRVRDCACLFSSGTRYQFQTDFIYAGLPTPSGFVSSTNLPFLLRTHTTKKTVTVRASFTSYLGFPFFLGFFFFFL